MQDSDANNHDPNQALIKLVPVVKKTKLKLPPDVVGLDYALWPESEYSGKAVQVDIGSNLCRSLFN